jgi:uncharacterized protein
MVTPAQLYGKNMAFAPRVDATGKMAWTEGEMSVRESIAIILRTRPGERIMRPDFGCGLDRYLFEPNTVSTLRLIQEDVKNALARWEPRIRLDDVRVETDPDDPRAVNITIYYTLVATQQREAVGLTLTRNA